MGYSQHYYGIFNVAARRSPSPCSTQRAADCLSLTPLGVLQRTQTNAHAKRARLPVSVGTSSGVASYRSFFRRRRFVPCHHHQTAAAQGRRALAVIRSAAEAQPQQAAAPVSLKPSRKARDVLFGTLDEQASEGCPACHRKHPMPSLFSFLLHHLLLRGTLPRNDGSSLCLGMHWPLFSSFISSRRWSCR